MKIQIIIQNKIYIFDKVEISFRKDLSIPWFFTFILFGPYLCDSPFTIELLGIPFFILSISSTV